MTISRKLAQKFNGFPLYRFKVESRTKAGKFYTVELYRNGKFLCDCPANCFQKIECYHIKKVKSQLNYDKQIKIKKNSI